jgi:hypothetical protein
MAQAESQSTTPIEWTLEELLEYLTLAPFGYEIDDALHEMERAISIGDLPLIDEEYVDGKLKRRYRLDPFYFRKHYTLEFDHRLKEGANALVTLQNMVRVVPRNEQLQWGKSVLHSYLVIEQDVRRVWPRRPPEPQTALDRQLTSKEWLKLEIDRRKKLDDIPKEITEFSEQLHSQMETAVRAGVVKRLIEARTIEQHLRDMKSLFVKKKRSS